MRQGSKRTASRSQAIQGFSEFPPARAFASTQEAPTPWGRSVPRPARRTPWDFRNSTRRRGTSGPKASTPQPAVDPEKHSTHLAARTGATPKARRMSVQPSWLYPESNSSRSKRRSGRRRLYQPPNRRRNRRHARLSAGRSLLSHASPWEGERCDSVVEMLRAEPQCPAGQRRNPRTLLLSLCRRPRTIRQLRGPQEIQSPADSFPISRRRFSQGEKRHEVASTRLSESAKNPQPPSLFWALRRNGMQVCATKAESPSVEVLRDRLHRQLSYAVCFIGGTRSAASASTTSSGS